MVPSALARLGQPCGNDPDALAPLGVGDVEQVISCHRQQIEARLAVSFPTIFAHNAKDIAEGSAGGLETHPVSGKIFGCLGVIPLEPVIFHYATA
jgi:hypothetical protein